jgi:hypothetical protein
MPQEQRAIHHMSIQEITRIAEETGATAQSKANRIKGWNLICCLYSESRSREEDLIHAYAVEAREVCIAGLRLVYARAEAGLRGNKERYERLGRTIEQLFEREMYLSSLCRESIKKTKAGKEVA